MDIVSIIDADGVIRFSSPSVERLLGYLPEKVVVGHEVFGMIRPADVAKVVEAFRRSVENPAAAIAVEYAVRHADGSVRHLESLDEPPLGTPPLQGSS